MAEIIIEQENEKISQEDINTVEKKVILDDFFSSFEESLLKPVIFQRPKDGETCDTCSG